MIPSDSRPRSPEAVLPDEELVARVRAGALPLFEELIRRHNRRLYRVARAIVRSEADAEEVMQESYVRAFAHLAEFEGRSSFATWLTRIAVHEALARMRRLRRETPFVEDAAYENQRPMEPRPRASDPEQRAAERELGALLERVVDGLPEHFRTVFVLRAVEELSVTETAECLELAEETVKTRFFRARALLREALADRFEALAPTAYAFHLARCDRIVAAVMNRLSAADARARS